MNTHIIVGVVSETPKLIEVDNKTPFIALKIQDITKYNRSEVNPVNTWDILKYGKKDNIERSSSNKRRYGYFFCRCNTWTI